MAQAFGHRMHVVLVQVEFLGNLRVGQVQAHEVQAQDPDGQGLVLPGQRRPGQVVEAPAARLTLVAPQMALRPVVAAPEGFATVAVGAVNARLPA